MHFKLQIEIETTFMLVHFFLISLEEALESIKCENDIFGTIEAIISKLKILLCYPSLCGSGNAAPNAIIANAIIVKVAIRTFFIVIKM